ncbi:MAG: hypothetical protein Q8W44_09415 [Candidatus Palauibacterales bacterium]|nr:hypothetical protein [Candidatus Palauibacterales bacterium]
MTAAIRRPGTGDGERGFALLAALLALLALSILATAGVFVVRSEGRMSRSHAAAVRARELARSGLSEYLASGPVTPGRRVFVHGRDTAVVAASRLLRPDADSTRVLFRLTSRGVRVRPGRPNAERRLSTLVLRDDSLPAGRVERPGTRHAPEAP